MSCPMHMITTYISNEDKNKLLTYTIIGVCNHLNEIIENIRKQDKNKLLNTINGVYNPLNELGQQFSNFKTQIGYAKTEKNIEKKKIYVRAALDHWTFGLKTKNFAIYNLSFIVVFLRNVIHAFKEHSTDVWIRDSETNKLCTVKRDEYFARQKLSHDEKCRRDIVTRSLRLRINKLLCDM